MFFNGGRVGVRGSRVVSDRGRLCGWRGAVGLCGVWVLIGSIKVIDRGAGAPCAVLLLGVHGREFVGSGRWGKSLQVFSLRVQVGPVPLPGTSSLSAGLPSRHHHGNTHATLVYNLFISNHQKTVSVLFFPTSHCLSQNLSPLFYFASAPLLCLLLQSFLGWESKCYVFLRYVRLLSLFHLVFFLKYLPFPSLKYYTEGRIKHNEQHYNWKVYSLIWGEVLFY